MEEKFKDILENGEEIVKVFKPNKKRYWRSGLFPLLIPIFWPHIILIMVLTLFTLPIWYAKGYKNLFYAYTNKRLIVRRGIFGVDFQSLEYKDITSSGVSVGFLDKGTGTGSISFMSPSAHGRPIVFNYIMEPYDSLKEIKEYMNSINEKK